MQQVLFHVPFTEGLVPPDGLPIPGFGLMLFLTFVLCVMVWGWRRGVKVGVPKERFQDLAIVLFFTGIAGARIVYMVQYPHHFEDRTPLGLFKAFFQIWNGGIVFYGSVFGGLLGYLVFRQAVLKPLGVNTWKLADAIAPLVALGLAVGRVGCYLNGCCWGMPACEEGQTVPLSADLGQFPLLPAHARDQVVRPAAPDSRLPQIHGLQTSTGFAVAPREPAGVGDPRTVVAAVEPGSAAAGAGLRAGDRVVGVSGRPNRVVVEASGGPDVVARATERLRAAGGEPAGDTALDDGLRAGRVAFDAPEAYQAAVKSVADLRGAGLTLTAHDTLWEFAREWPRGENRLALSVQRGGQTLDLAFTPRTVPFFPTQLYEAVSMVLLIGVLLAFQPLRRHDGQMLVVLMLGYAVHRVLNEAIRIEPTYALDLTLSQWISVGIFAAGLVLEAYLRMTQPRLPPGPVPLGYGVEQPKPATAAA